MTMLDRMRRHRGWLKWSLAIVVVSFVLLYIPSFMRDGAQGAANNSVVADVEGREITAGQFRRDLPAADGGLPPVLRRQRRRQAAQAARHRPADRPADDPGRGVAGRGQSARDQGERRRDPRADPGAAGVPGERPVHRRPALPPAAPDAEPADAPRRVRGPGPPQHRGREAAGRAHRLDDRRRQGRRRRVQEAQRAGQGDGRQLPRRQVPRGAGRHRRRGRQALRGQQGVVPDRREAQDPLPERSTSRRCVARATVTGQQIERAYNDNIQQVLDPRAGPRQPHPAQDRGQRRRGGEEAGRGAPRARSRRAPTSASSPRRTRRTRAAPRRTATSTSSPRARWCRSSTRPPSR